MRLHEAAASLGVSAPTLRRWLAEDAEGKRLLQFHTIENRRLVWTVDGFRQLREAVLRERKPGGILAGKWSGRGTAKRRKDVAEALARGEPVDTVAERYGLARVTVQDMGRAAGVRDQVQLPPWMLDQLERLPVQERVVLPGERSADLRNRIAIVGRRWGRRFVAKQVGEDVHVWRLS